MITDASHTIQSCYWSITAMVKALKLKWLCQLTVVIKQNTKTKTR